MCELIPIPNEFDDFNDFWPHPIYKQYDANRKGIIRNVKHKREIGTIRPDGYLRISINDSGTRKGYYNHRFIYECYNGKINNPKLVVDHINEKKTDNRLENLQLITERQNMKRVGKNLPFLPPAKIRATNMNTGESSDYDSITKCSKGLDINSGLICKVLNGNQKTSKSKLDGNKYYFERL